MPQEATEAQRRAIAERALAAVEAQSGPVSAPARALWAQYVAGTLTVAEAVRALTQLANAEFGDRTPRSPSAT